MKPTINPNKLVVFSGAGISAESGIPTFRGNGGLWAGRDPIEIASAEAWAQHPDEVIAFHNERLKELERASPNPAHLAIAEYEDWLEQTPQNAEGKPELVVITQNVDNLHERAGSKNVIHLHGCVTQVRLETQAQTIIERGFKPLAPGETDTNGQTLRPNIVLFGEDIHHYSEAAQHLAEAGRVLVVGTSLTVQPAAGLLKKSRFQAEKVIVSLEIDKKPFGFKFLRGAATLLVPEILNGWKV